MKPLVYINCPLCDASIYRRHCLLNGWQLVQCLSCDFIYVNPRPSAEVFENAYRIPISESHKNKESVPVSFGNTYQNCYAYTSEEKQKQFTDILIQLLRLINTLPSKCRLLDFGCGSGAFLKQAVEIGIDAYGYDIGDWIQPFIQQNSLTSRIFIGDFAEASYPNESFDIVHSRAVLEHLYAPRKFLAQINQKLKPTGILALMSIPNIDSIFIRLGIDSYDGNVPLLHLNFFSKKTLSHFLQNNGFHPLYTKTWGVPLRLSAPPYLQRWMGKGRRYYQSDQDLNIDGWQEQIGQSCFSYILRNLHLYNVLKVLCNTMLNAIDGGTVIDMIAVKQ